MRSDRRADKYAQTNSKFSQFSQSGKKLYSVEIFKGVVHCSVLVPMNTHWWFKKKIDQYDYLHRTFKWVLKVTTRYVLFYSHFMYKPLWIGNYAVTPTFRFELLSKLCFLGDTTTFHSVAWDRLGRRIYIPNSQKWFSE